MPERIPHDEEITIIKAARAGDGAAFSRLMSVYERPIFNYIYRMVDNRPDSEDLTQEVFIKVFKHLGSYNVDRPFRPWLYTIATRTVYDWLRKRQRRPESLILDDPEAHFETIDPVDTYAVIEAKLDLDRGLARLKPIYQTVLLLFYQQQLAYEEIAAVLGVPINTVKTYLHRAKAALRLSLNY